MGDAVGRLAKTSNFRHSPIRRLFFRQDLYICGMCRRSYEEKKDGERCLIACSRNFALRNGVEVLRYMGTPHFKCRYCRRLYSEIQDAQSCVKECVPNYWKQIGEAELDLDAPKEKQRPKKYLKKPEKIKLKAIPPYKLRNMISNEDIDKEIDESLANSDESAEAIAAAKAKAEEANQKKTRLKSELAEQFLRQGAQYQCTYCMELYYTKVEVVKCFADHPEELPEDRQ